MSNFTVYRASAGSGKTFSLVVEFLSIALSDKSGKAYRKILGVTFTNKAAAELKERILRFLKEISLPESDPDYNQVVSEKLCERLKISKAELAYRARLTFTDILHNYSRLSVSTIDKFVLRLIRSFSRELKIDVEFQLELDQTSVFEKIARQVIGQIGKDEQLSNWIISWLLSKVEEGNTPGNYEGEIVAFMNVLSTDEAQEFRSRFLELNDEQRDLANKKIRDIIHNFESEIHRLGTESWQLIMSQSLEIEDFAYGKNGLATYFKRIEGKNYSKLLAGTQLKGTFEKQVLHSGKSMNKAAIASIAGQLTENFYAIHQLCENQHAHYKLALILRKKLYIVGLARRLETLLEEYRLEKGIQLISDFNKKIAEVVVNEPAPYIYEMLGERYEHFLIDEFQDTSTLQWQNFLPLVDNSLARGGSTLVVGDGKQSIYRFRGGEVEQFQQLPKIFKSPGNGIYVQYEENLHNYFNIVNIEDNFRSSRTVVEFNNSLIDSLPTFLGEPYSAVFQDGKQNVKRKYEGFVRVNILEKEEDGAPLDEQNIELLVSDLRKLQELGYAWSDCCVLTNTNAQGSWIARELMNEKIPIISEESLLVLFSPKSRLLLGCFQLLNNETDSAGQINLIENAVYLKLLEGDVLSLFEKYCSGGSRNTGKKCDIDRLFRDLGVWKKGDELKGKDLYWLAEHFSRTFAFDQQADPFVQFFLDNCLSFMLKNGNHLSEFVLWWSQNAEKARVNIPEGLNAVRIMTVHKSKGLEFENVLFPFVSWSSRNTKDELWIEPGEEFEPLKAALIPNSAASSETAFAGLVEVEKSKDKLDDANKMYVGLTRAANNLFVYASAPRKKESVCYHFVNWVKFQDKFDPENSFLQLGTLEPKGEHRKKEKPFLTLESLQSTYDRNKLKFGYQAPKYWSADNQEKERSRGTLLHNLMSRINSSADLDRISEHYNRDGQLSEEEFVWIYSNLQKLVERGESEGWLGSSLKAANEMSLLYTASGLSEVIRPDRVIFKENETLVIDYKSGSEEESHEVQLAKYISALRDMGYPEVSGRLVYLDK